MDKKKLSALLSTFILCFLFWMLLVFSVSPREIILGLAVSAVVSLFASRFLIHSEAFYLYNPVRLFTLLAYFIGVLLVEIIKANLAMVKIVLSGSKDIHPGVIRVPAAEDIRSEYGQALVADSITLTPGTITMDVADDEDGKTYYYVQWIDVSETDRDKAGEIIKGKMENWIGRIWK